MGTQFNNFIFLQRQEADLLGETVFTGRNMHAALASRCVELNTVVSRLSLLSAHDALILFRASFSACSQYDAYIALFTVRRHPALEEFGNQLRNGFVSS